jgi:uncharacterized RDD family membrane protein YckC
MQERLPKRLSLPFSWDKSSASFAVSDANFDGISWRRTAAFLFDAFVLLAIFILLQILNILTFFTLSPLLTFLWPAFLFVLYDTVLIGGRGSATLGMRLMALKAINHQGNEPGNLQAFVLSVLFYLSVSFTFGFVLLVALFNNKGRCLHDIVTGVFIITAKTHDAKSE